MFLAAKIFAGIANAYLGPGLVCYVSEISMPKIRGAMTMPFAFMFAAGSLFGSICLKAVQVRPDIEQLWQINLIDPSSFLL